jgi:RNA polymerase sigma-70 factor (ECF subfamily)
MMSDEELVARSRSGDLDSFNQLVLRWERPIYALAYRVIGREEDARDVAQETFLRAFRALSGFKGQAKFSSWLYRITLNLCRDWIRRERRTPIAQAPEGIDLVELAGESPDEESIEDLVSRKELGRAVAKAMALLPDEQRTAIILKEYHGLTFQEIADLLDCPLSTVKTRLYQGLTVLRRHLREGDAESGRVRTPGALRRAIESNGRDKDEDDIMCDKELLIDYLYGEMAATERAAFDRHLADCGDCRAEVDSLRGVRTHLASWAPPEPELDFQIVRSPKVAARRWRFAPAFGLAAAAMLTIAVSAAVAHVQIQSTPDGYIVRTGWSRAASPAGPVVPGSTPAVDQLEARIKALEGQLASTQHATPVALTSADASRLSDAELIRLVRRLISESEDRQQAVLARQILQVNRDVQTARQTDYDRLLYGMQRIQGAAVETSQRQKLIEDHLVRIGMQR